MKKEKAKMDINSALTRDGELGRLVSSAFNFPPPAMPEFRE